MQLALWHRAAGLCIGVFEPIMNTDDTMIVGGFIFKNGEYNNAVDDSPNDIIEPKHSFNKEYPKWVHTITSDQVYVSTDLTNVPPAYSLTYPTTVKFDSVEMDSSSAVPVSSLIETLQSVPSTALLTSIDFDGFNCVEGDFTYHVTEIQEIGSLKWNEKCKQTLRSVLQSMWYEVRDTVQIQENRAKNEKQLRDIIANHPDLAKRIMEELSNA